MFSGCSAIDPATSHRIRPGYGVHAGSAVVREHPVRPTFFGLLVGVYASGRSARLGAEQKRTAH
jgi:hypothetical protein